MQSCPTLPKLQTLWCNNNKISNLHDFLDEVVQKFPRIKYLSLMRNPISTFDHADYDTDSSIRYRLTVISKLPSLQILDSIYVTNEELEAAKRLQTELFSFKETANSTYITLCI